MPSVLFVCTGNICRSPTAEGIFRHIIRQHEARNDVTCDSAGTHGYHVGEAPDSRSVALARSRGIEIQDLRARKFVSADFEKFTHIIAMDSGHERTIRDMAPMNPKAHISLLMDYHPQYAGMDVPDPYYGTTKDFEETYALIEAGILALADQILVKTAR